MSSNKAWVTLATNDSYSLGALVLAHSLKTVKTAYKLAILITPGVTAPMKQQIEAVFDDVKTVDVLDSKDQAHLTLMSRPELGVTFTKLHCWTFTDYEKCVFLDADTLVLQNCDELFEREELSAAPDPGWPDCFNSGVFVYKPSQDTFNELLEFARTRGSFDGGDQGLLNMFFKDWALTDISKHLSFTYNVVWSSTYSYLPALKQFGQNMKIVHFIASSKPWLQSFNMETRLVTATSGGTGLQTLLQLWWDLFCHHVHPRLSTEMIESRLSSRYSEVPSNNNNPNIHTPNNTPCNNNSSDYYTPTCEPPKEDYYSFVDPWDEYLVAASDQKKYEIEEVPICESRIDNSKGGDVMVEVCLGNLCEKEVENNSYINDCEETTNCSFQNNAIENCNISDNEEKNTKHLEEVRELIEEKQEQGNGNYPACSDDIPINPNSSLSVNNSRPDSPTHCEVPMDLQTYVLDGGLAGQFARLSLNEKTADQKALEDFIRRQSWEHGNVDYLGKDSFSNIWAKINETLGNTTEVQIEVDVLKTASPPEVVYTEDPKPLKSALKKTSTTTPPVESELIDNSKVPVKQLEKLDLSKDDLKQPGTPETPTVISPTPPTTPASQAQQLPQKPEEIPKDDISTKVSLGSAKPEPPKPEAVELKKETTKCEQVELVEKGSPKPKAVEPKKEATKCEQVELVEKGSPKPVAVKPKEESLPKSDSTVSKPDKPVKEVSQPTETARQPESSIDSSTPLVSNDPPVAPKRSNKGSSTSAHKNVKPSENK